MNFYESGPNKEVKFLNEKPSSEVVNTKLSTFIAEKATGNKAILTIETVSTPIASTDKMQQAPVTVNTDGILTSTGRVVVDNILSGILVVLNSIEQFKNKTPNDIEKKILNECRKLDENAPGTGSIVQSVLNDLVKSRQLGTAYSCEIRIKSEAVENLQAYFKQKTLENQPKAVSKEEVTAEITAIQPLYCPGKNASLQAQPSIENAASSVDNRSKPRPPSQA